MATQITLTYKNEKYVLEYSRLTASAIEKQGYARILLSTGASQFPFFDEFVNGVFAAMEQTHHVFDLHYIWFFLEIFENISFDHMHITSFNF